MYSPRGNDPLVSLGYCKNKPKADESLVSARYYKHQGECIRTQKATRQTHLRKQRDWDINQLCGVDLARLPIFESSPNRNQHAQLPGPLSSQTAASYSDFDMETASSRTAVDVLHASVAMQKQVKDVCETPRPGVITSSGVPKETVRCNPTPVQGAPQRIDGASPSSRHTARRSSGPTDQADARMQKKVHNSQPAREGCIIIPQAPVESQTFGYGVPAVTKEIPPCARAVPIVEAPDLTPEERFQSTYKSTFAKAAQGIGMTKKSARSTAEQPSGLPMRYKPAETLYVRDQQKGWHVRRGFELCSSAQAPGE